MRLDSYPRYAEERSRYLKDCTYIAKLLKAHLAALAIILPKYNDDYTLEVVQAFHDAGWTTIVYDREGTVTRKRLDYVAPIVAEQAPTCDYVIAYNDTHKAFFEKVIRLSGIEPPSVIVMGNPALDEWFEEQRPSEPRGTDAAGRNAALLSLHSVSSAMSTTPDTSRERPRFASSPTFTECSQNI